MGWFSDNHEASQAYNAVCSSPAACAVRAVDCIITGFRSKALVLTRVKSLTSSLPALRPMKFVPVASLSSYNFPTCALGFQGI